MPILPKRTRMEQERHVSPRDPAPLTHTMPWKWLGLAALIFACTFFFFYPSHFVSIDEHEYLKNAFLLVQNNPNGNPGALYTNDNTLYCGGAIAGSGTWLSTYPAGKSIFLIPFTFASIDWIFVSGLLIHLLNFFLLALILRKRGNNPLWAILYLVFPAFVWEARTLFSESLVLTLFLAAFLAWIQEDDKFTFLAGLFAGLSVAVRYDAIFGVLGFGAQALAMERKKLIPFLMGGAIALIIFAGINFWAYGVPFKVSYATTTSNAAPKGINPFLGENLLTLILVTLIVLPLSWLTLFPPKRLRFLAEKKYPFFFAVLFFLTLIFFSEYSNFWTQGSSIAHILTVRLRYYIPLLGMLMIPAIGMYEELWKRLARRIPSLSSLVRNPFVRTLGALVLLGGVIFMQSTHADLLQPRSDIQDIIAQHIPTDAQIIGSADDCIYFVPAITGQQTYTKIVDASPALLAPGTAVYFLNISYATQENNDTLRQQVVDRERKVMTDFLTAHQGELELVFQDRENGFIEIWKWKS